MTMRERVIIGFTGVAVVWAGVSFFQGQRPGKSDGGRTEKGQAMDVEVFAAQTKARLAAARLTDVERGVLDSAGTEWDGSLFGDAGPVRVKEADAPPPYIYGGFVQVGAERFAVVNGREYRLNDLLEDGNRVVESIEPDQVVLKSVHGNGRPLTIPFQNPGLTKE